MPASSAAPSAGRLAHRRDLDRALRRVGERLHERRVVGHAAVDAHVRDRDAAVGLGRVDEVGAAVRDAFEHRAHDLGPAGAARQPEERAARAVVPRGRAEPERRGHEHDAAGVGARRRERRATRRTLAMSPRSSRSHCTFVPAASITASTPHVIAAAVAPRDDRERAVLVALVERRRRRRRARRRACRRCRT